MSVKTDNFINIIAPLAVNEYLSRDIWILPSVCIAQAALESGWNLNASTLFGIKGKGFTATTSEWYSDHYEIIEASFRQYPDVASAVVGYYDFLRDTPRYKNALNNTDYKDAVDKLIHTADGFPYATDPNYIDTIIKIIERYNLTSFDERNQESKPEEVESLKDGDEINLKSGATYYNGQKIPSWVLKCRLYYRGRNNNGVIFSTMKKGAITGVVKESDVIEITNQESKPEEVESLKDGDEITLKSGATYYNVQKIPSWVFKSRLYYRGTNNNGVIFSTLKTGAITGVVKKSDISKV